MRKIIPILMLDIALVGGALSGATYLGERHGYKIFGNDFACRHALAHIKHNDFLGRTLLYAGDKGAEGFYEANCR